MKKTRFTEEQMVTILREADAKPVPEVAKKHGVSAQTIYAWRTLRQLGADRREAIATARAGERTVEKDGRRPGPGNRRPEGDHAKKMVGARVRRQQVTYAEGRGLSRRRACALLSVARSTIGYVSRLVARDALGLAALRTLAGQYPRHGYRRIRIFLERQGRPRPPPPTAVNHVWAYDFVFDTCADGRTLKCLTVIDEFTRECLAIDVEGGIRSGRVIEVLTQLVSVHGAPRFLRSDNGLPPKSGRDDGVHDAGHFGGHRGVRPCVAGPDWPDRRGRRLQTSGESCSVASGSRSCRPSRRRTGAAHSLFSTDGSCRETGPIARCRDPIRSTSEIVGHSRSGGDRGLRPE